MSKKMRIQLILFRCPICKKNYFSYQERAKCPECAQVKFLG